MNNIYDIDFKKLSNRNIPHYLKKSKAAAFVNIITKPFLSAYQNFLRHRKAVLYDLMITTQVCYIEMMLNDRYDYIPRRIYIVDNKTYPPVYLYKDVENKDIHLFTNEEGGLIYLYTDGEAAIVQVDFVVMVPYDVQFDHAEMRSLILRKRLPGLTFTIQKF